MAGLKCDGAETAMSRKGPDENDKDPFKIDAAWERELKHVFRRHCTQGGLAGLLDHLPACFAHVVCGRGGVPPAVKSRKLSPSTQSIPLRSKTMGVDG